MTDMKLRFDVDQAECFRAGINHPSSTAVIDIDPEKIPQTERNLIADRLDGIDVCKLWNSDKGTEKCFTSESYKPIRIEAKAPTYDALMQGILENQKEVENSQARHRSVALGMAAQGGVIVEVLDPNTGKPKKTT